MVSFDCMKLLVRIERVERIIFNENEGETMNILLHYDCSNTEWESIRFK
jgi:hypothetical protein